MLCRHHGSIPVWQVERDAGWRGHQHLSGVVGCGAGCLAILWDWQCQCGTQLLLVVNVWEVLVCPVTVVLDEDDCKIKTVCDGATDRGLASVFFLLLPIQSCRSVAAHTVLPASSKFEQNNQPNYPGKQLLQLAIFQNADIQRCCNPRRTGCALAVIKHGCMDNTLVIIDT